jgi:drug/metabolite transporter (DMT)-like permease
MLALKRTSGSNTAFIVQLSIVITPIIVALLERKLPSKKTVFLALVAILGIYLITCNGKSFSIGLGDFFALCNALFFSLFIALQNKISHLIHPAKFTFIQHITNTVSFSILALIFERGSININALSNVTFLLLITLNSAVVIFTAIFQNSAIKFVRPESATIIYSFEPVIASILGLTLLGEKFGGIYYIVGCLLILLAALFTVTPIRLNLARPMISTNNYSER